MAKQRLTLIAVLIIAELFTISVFADKKAGGPPTGFSAGPGVIISDKPYKGMDTETNAFPFFMYEGEDFYLRGPSFGYKVYDKDGLSLDALLSWRFDGYDDDDSDDLDGMDARDMTAEMGAALSYKDSFGTTRLSFLNDVLGRHDGRELELSYSKTYRDRQLTVTPSAGINWQSENFTDYYYGVRSKEALASRPTYHPSDAVNLFMSVRMTYQLNEQWNIFTRFKHEWLSNEISDSPIVDKSRQNSFMAGLIYQF